VLTFFAGLEYRVHSRMPCGVVRLGDGEVAGEQQDLLSEVLKPRGQLYSPEAATPTLIHAQRMNQW
jgi:hypothetical protein